MIKNIQHVWTRFSSPLKAYKLHEDKIYLRMIPYNKKSSSDDTFKCTLHIGNDIASLLNIKINDYVEVFFDISHPWFIKVNKTISHNGYKVGANIGSSNIRFEFRCSIKQLNLKNLPGTEEVPYDIFEDKSILIDLSNFRIKNDR